VAELNVRGILPAGNTPAAGFVNRNSVFYTLPNVSMSPNFPAIQEGSSMKSNVVWAAFICLFCVGPACAQTGRANQASREGKADLARLERAVLHDQIDRCEVFCLPFETAGGMAPGYLEHFFKYKLEIDLLSSRSKLLTSLCRAIKETKVSSSDPNLGDFHWGCKLFGEKGKRVYSIYIDNTGKIAVVNGHKMKFQGGLDAWFKSNFIDRFDGVGD